MPPSGIVAPWFRKTCPSSSPRESIWTRSSSEPRRPSSPSASPGTRPAATSPSWPMGTGVRRRSRRRPASRGRPRTRSFKASARKARSEEHTSELQSHHELVCRLLLEKIQNYDLGMDVRQLAPLPDPHLLSHRLEVSLHLVDSE